MDPSNEIRKLRKDADLSQGAFANLIGVTQPTVSRWESGEAEPSGPVLIAARHLTSMVVAEKRKKGAA